MSTKQPQLGDADYYHGQGKVREAIAVCDLHLSADSDLADRCLLLATKGAIRFDAGDVTDAVSCLTRAFDLACSETVGPLRAKIGLALFSRLSQFQSPAETLPVLSRVRQLAAEAGSADSLGGLHLVVARLGALTGQVANSRRHLELSRRLLQGSGPAIKSGIHLVDAALEICAGNLDRAKRAATIGLETARETDRAAVIAGCLTNMGSVLLLTGKSKQARLLLERSMELSGELLLVQFSTVDALLQADMYEGDHTKCERNLQRCREILAAHRVPARSWYDLAHQLTRGTYFERLGQWQEVVAIAEETEPELARRQYKTLSTTLLCLKARALGRLGAHDRAEAALGLAVRTCPRGAVDPLIVLEASQGLCAMLRGETEVGHAHVERAVAGCRAIGHQYHERWITRAVEDLRLRQRAVVPTTSHRDSVSDGLVLADVATILGAGHSVDLMAHRTVSLLRGTPLGPRVEVQAEGGCEYQPEPTATCHTAPDGTVALELRGSDRCVTIRVSRVDTIDEIAIIKNIADLLQAAVSRTSDPGQDDDDQDLWPKAAIASDDDAVFRSPRMVELLKIATRLAATDLPVLLTGETGTGKEIFARLIHDHSRQRRGPFVPFNCSAIARDLVESQLFGHRRGAFTGAHETFGGVIRSAERGTLFLDEVGDLDPAIQPKLLRFLEHGEVHAVGEPRPHTVAVRLVAATNADLEALIHQGRFRSDLYYRLGVTKLVIPPLRERKDEIPAMASRFVARASRECGRVGLRLGDDFLAALLLYDWPGNIRELVNEIRRVVALAADGDVLSAQQLSPGIASRWRSRPATPVEPPPPGLYVRLDQTLAQAVSQVEEQFIERALGATGGRVTEAAQLLGLSRKGLFLKRRRRRMLTAPDTGTRQRA